MTDSIIGVWCVVESEATEGVLLVICGGKSVGELVSFTDNFRVHRWMPGDDETFRNKYRLLENTQPAAIDLYNVNPEKICRAIYRLDGDRLVMCVATDGAARPMEFAVRSPEQILVQYERSSEQIPTPNRKKRRPTDLLKPGKLIPEGFLD